MPREQITSSEGRVDEGREALISYVAFMARNWKWCGLPDTDREAWLLAMLRWIDALSESERRRIVRALPWPSVPSVQYQQKLFSPTA